MKLKRLLYILIAVLVACITVAAPPAEAAKKKRAKTTQSASKKKSTGKKSTQRRSGKKKKKRSAAPAPPKETVSNDSLTLLVNDILVAEIDPTVNPGGLRVNLAKPEKSARSLRVQLNESFTYLPVNKELISGFEARLASSLPDSLADYSISFKVGNKLYSSFINVIDRLPEEARKNVPFVVPANPYVHPVKGMEGDIVALWHSHGRYYRSGSGWLWQRPFLFQTAEDIYTMSYVLPFLVPMLENAGAYVMLPRERDINIHEVIVDNDLNPYGDIYSQTTYKEMNGAKKWATGQYEGFIYDIPDFRDTENPFENGTYRQVETLKSGKFSVAGWYADIPEDGEYAVYVSYKSLPESSHDARYTVNYSGGSREFIVNQTMGGGTWIYLGTFPFRAGYDDSMPLVTLSNKTEKGGSTVVTADAVKIGGGMGNIARSPRRADVSYGTDEAAPQEVMPAPQDSDDEGDTQDSEESEEEESSEEAEESDGEEAVIPPSPAPAVAPRFTTSGLPRFLEGARYWLHWAGFPESVYSPYHGADDYKDDYCSRGLWVNWLAGGSRVLPNRQGLNIPVDISFALHTDAGKRADDSFVGTLGIYYTDGGKSYGDGTPRNNSHILTDMIMRQVTGDIRQTFEPRWTRRSMWDKSYAEARSPEVPATLLELLSHQNFADMQYGLDPSFRFWVSRAVYKAMGRFVSERKGRDFIVQPLPVHSFAVKREKKGVFRLTWLPMSDPLEPSATPSKYIIMERTEGNLGFRKIGETHSTNFDIKVNDSKIHSVYVIAANEGGLSFPSETLAFREGNGKPILIVNGFTRVSGPAHFSEGGRAGFRADEDFGVPYKYDISFGGYQQEFSRGAGESFGRSGSNHVATVAGGNTFDYPALHGSAIAAAGRGFVSTSVKAVEEGHVNLADYALVDLILGSQKRTVVGNGKSGVRFEAFPHLLREKLSDYISRGGDMIISGQHVASDLYAPGAGPEAADFAASVLCLADSVSVARSRSGKVVPESVDPKVDGKPIGYSNSLRRESYIVESPDVLVLVEGARAVPILRFSDTGEVAGLSIDKGKSRLFILSVPLESLSVGSLLPFFIN